MKFTDNHTPELAGKGKRYAVGPSVSIDVRLTPESLSIIKWATHELAYLKEPKEKLSQSAIVRRALKIYRIFLLHVLNDPALVVTEKKEARQDTKLPNPPRPRDVQRRDKRRATVAYNRANPQPPTFSVHQFTK